MGLDWGGEENGVCENLVEDQNWKLGWEPLVMVVDVRR
jgi:hypothetical protein